MYSQQVATFSSRGNCPLVSSPDPHPFTRRNDLVNQVQFLELAHAFVTV